MKKEGKKITKERVHPRSSFHCTWTAFKLKGKAVWLMNHTCSIEFECVFQRLLWVNRRFPSFLKLEMISVQAETGDIN